jgi:hypothetical protein
MRGGSWVVVLAFACTLFAMPAGGAAAQPGRLVATVPGSDGPAGVSVAFDGTFLYYTGQDGLSDDNAFELHRVRPTNPTDHVDFPIVGAPGINAFSYDSTRGMFWAAGSQSDPDGYPIYLMDKTGHAQLVMNLTAPLVSHGFCDTQGDPVDVGCKTLVDGVGYDATTDTIWYSPDESNRIYNFEVNDDPLNVITPVLRGWFDINDPGTGAEPDNMAPECGDDFSSGVAAGGSVLYLTNGNCHSTTPGQLAWFFRYAKTLYNPPIPPAQLAPGDRECLPPGGDSALTATNCPGDKLFVYPYDAERAEDDECDDVTFNVDVMWIRDSLDDAMRAYEVPSGTCIFGGGVAVAQTGPVGRFTGGGYLLATVPPGVKAHTSFVLQCNVMDKPSRLQATWANGNHFHMERATAELCDTQPAPLPPSLGGSTSSGTFDRITGHGEGRYNGMGGATVDWSFTDNGEPGSNDVGHITVKDAAGRVVLQADGTLVGGNYQAHG